MHVVALVFGFSNVGVDPKHVGEGAFLALNAVGAYPVDVKGEAKTIALGRSVHFQGKRDDGRGGADGEHFAGATDEFLLASSVEEATAGVGEKDANTTVGGAGRIVRGAGNVSDGKRIGGKVSIFGAVGLALPGLGLTNKLKVKNMINTMRRTTG